MNPEYTPLIVEPIRYKLWRGRPLDMSEKELIDQALEKQVYAKAEKDSYRDIDGSVKSKRCPKCDTIAQTISAKHCYECGQKY